MKTIYLCLIPLFCFGVIYAQQRDLDFYIAQAQANSPLINKSKNDIKILELDLNQIDKILNNPEVNLSANVLLAPIISHDNNKNNIELISAGATNYSGYDLAISNGGQYTAIVSVKQPLFSKQKYQDYIKRADVLKNINENNLNLSVHEMSYLITNQYQLCVQSQKQSNISQELIGQLKDELDLMQKLVAHAIYKQTDLMLLQIEYQNFKMAYQTNLATYKSNLYDLNLLCGINDTTFVDLKPVDFKLNTINNSSSIFLKSYQLDSLSIMADQQISKQKYLPQINWFADAGLNAIYKPTFNRLGFSTSLSLSWTVFDGNQKKIQQDKSRIQTETIAFDKQNFENKNQLTKSKILNQLHMIDKQLVLINNQLNQYSTLLDAYQKELTQGLISVIDFKMLTRDLTLKKIEALQLKTEKQALINSYNYWNN